MEPPLEELFVALLRSVEANVFHGRLPSPEHDPVLIRSLMDQIFSDAPQGVQAVAEECMVRVLGFLRMPPENFLRN